MFSGTTGSMSSEVEQVPTTVDEVDSLLRRGHAILFINGAGDIGMRLYHREGESHPIRTVDYPIPDSTRYYGHADVHIRDWLEDYDVEVEPGGGYASEPESI